MKLIKIEDIEKIEKTEDVIEFDDLINSGGVWGSTDVDSSDYDCVMRLCNDDQYDYYLGWNIGDRVHQRVILRTKNKED